IAIIFISWKRRHYDKSTLSFFSDCAYQCKHLPDHWSKKASILKFEVIQSIHRVRKQSCELKVKKHNKIGKLHCAHL
ncbi:unnamed protein product, partial [Porites evermanni]